MIIVSLHYTRQIASRVCKAAGPLERVAMRSVEREFTDVVGPMKHQTLSKSRYFVTIVDECNRYLMIKFVHSKGVS